MKSPRISVYIATSLDGFIARHDGSIDFLSAVEVADEDYGYAEFLRSVDALVIGRKTYETVLGFDAWPFEGKSVFVLTHGEREALHGEIFLKGEPHAIVEALARHGARHVYLDGGEAIRGFLAQGWVDAITLSVIPVLLGSGRRLFEDGLPEAKLALEDSRVYATGLVQLRYRVG